MHYITTVVVHIPATVADSKVDKEVQEYREKLVDALSDVTDIGPRAYLKCHIDELGNHLNAFGREVVEAVDKCMEPYSECTENPKYLDFLDMTEEIDHAFEHHTGNYVKFPNGTILPIYANAFSSKFAIKDGLVYEKDWGPLKTLKRTKKAKKIRYLQDYPVKKIYKTKKELAECYCDADFNDETQSYGRYFNFDSFWDWYRIGGRWPKTFLVKSDCEEYSIGNIDDEKTLEDAPEGYKWTSAARKKDICWDAMVAYLQQEACKNYYTYKGYFEAGELPSNYWLNLKEDGVYSYDNRPVYLRGETLEEYLHRRGYSDDASYLMTPCYYLDADSDYWKSEDCTKIEDGETKEAAWLKELRSLYNKLSDDAVLVSVDIHQ